MGCVARIVQAKPIESGQHEIHLHGVCRIRILHELSRRTHFAKQTSPFVRIECLPDPADYRDAPAVARLKQLADRLHTSPNEVATLRTIRHGGQLADLVASYTDLGMNERQELLETLDVRERVARTIQLLESRHMKGAPGIR
jgi:ATP-dependent Lon protease